MNVRTMPPLLLLMLALACGRSAPPPEVAPEAAPPERMSAGAVDSLWQAGVDQFSHGKWDDAVVTFERLTLEMPSGDSRLTRARFYVAEAKLAQGDQLQAAREFRKVSDETPSDSLAPDALLRVGDAYAQLWRRPELDPTYGQTALATYQELLNRYPGTSAAARAQERIVELHEKFAVKAYKEAMFYYRFKAYDSAIIYLKDLVATYPRSDVAPEALVRLIEAYRQLGYQEDVQETCGYLRRFHPDAPGTSQACPGDTAGAS